MQDLRVNYPFIASSGADSTSLPAGAFLVIISNAHVMEGTRVMKIGYGVDQRGQTLFKKDLAGVCFPTDSSVDLAIYFVPVETSELQMNGVISFAPLPTASVVPETGSRIFALANPERMARSIAQGLLSGLRPDLIQFDAPISKGSSGGAVFDEYGNLLGIIFGYLNEAGAQNLNFAIPAERIRPLMLGAGSLCYRSAPAELLPEKSPQGTRQD
jgi:S1-C subfamily serine protease